VAGDQNSRDLFGTALSAAGGSTATTRPGVSWDARTQAVLYLRGRDTVISGAYRVLSAHCNILSDRFSDRGQVNLPLARA
jgi:hypothetical protein